MPIEYRVEPGSRIVRTIASGILTEAETMDLYARMRDDPAFEPGYRQLCDLQGVTGISASTEFLQTLAQVSIFSRTSRRAFVADGDLTFGLARMLQAFCEQEGRQVGVFRTLAEAERWLGPSDDGAQAQ